MFEKIPRLYGGHDSAVGGGDTLFTTLDFRRSKPSWPGMMQEIGSVTYVGRQSHWGWHRME